MATGVSTSGAVWERGRALRWTHLAAVALATWLGVHALRTFLAVVVWTIGENRPPTQLGLIALAIWIVGLLAGPAARLAGGPRPAARFAGLFGILYAANQFVAHPILTPALGPAAVVAWMWFVAAFVTSLGRRGGSAALAPGIIVGLAAQVALQAALHGMDMTMLRGLLPGITGLALAALLYLAVRAATSGAPSATSAPPAWGLAALGPFLVLEVTLLVNLGRVEMMTGWDLPSSGALILGGLVLGAALTTGNAPPSAWRVGNALLAVLVSAGLAFGSLTSPWFLPLEQALLSIALVSALAPSPRGGRPTLWLLVGAMLFFVLVFLYYQPYGWPALWPVMAALAVLPSLAIAPPTTAPSLRPLAAALVVAVAGWGLSVALEPRRATAAGPAPVELRIFDYNIHQAFDYWSVPDPEDIVRVVAASGADLVALQEVARGWNVNGGVDLAAYLRWRLPQYHLIYGPMNGDLWGNVILSRYPVRESGFVRYPIRVSAFQRGLVWAIVPTEAGDLLFVSTHFSAYGGFDEDRTGQAGDLLAFWRERPRSVIAGDFNAHPDTEAIRRILASGLVDVPGAHGLGEAFTYGSANPYERIDYIFTSPDVLSVDASIPQTTASDHLPVAARVRLR